MKTGSVLLFAYCLIAATAQAQTQQVLGQAIVRFTASAYAGFTYQSPGQPWVITSNPDISALFDSLHVDRIDRVHPYDENSAVGISTGMNRAFVLYFPDTANVDSTVERLRRNFTVEHADPNYLLEITVNPNDVLYPQQWGLQKINIPAAWDVQKGSENILIAILDVGFKLDHPDLQGKFDQSMKWDAVDIRTSDYKPSEYQFISGEDYYTPDSDPTGTGTHGTEVAGMAAAETNNNIGISGVGWNTRIIPIRCGFMIYRWMGYGWDTKGTFEQDDWIRALDYVRTNTSARVVNMSFGGGAWQLEAEQSIASAVSANIVICAASGNDNFWEVSWPAAYPGAIAVGASDEYDHRVDNSGWGSNYGPGLSLVAPGIHVATTSFDASFQSNYN